MPVARHTELSKNVVVGLTAVLIFVLARLVFAPADGAFLFIVLTAVGGAAIVEFGLALYNIFAIFYGDPTV